MKKNNPSKKLRLLKKTIAHLNNEQMYAAHGGATITRLACTKNYSAVVTDCLTDACAAPATFDCELTKNCA